MTRKDLEKLTGAGKFSGKKKEKELGLEKHIRMFRSSDIGYLKQLN